MSKYLLTKHVVTPKKKTDPKKLADNIRLFRLTRRWTQSDLAKKSRVSQSTIAGIENYNKSPSLTTLCRIAKAFRVDIGELFG